MGKRIALVVGLLGFIATVIGLYSDVSGLLGGDDSADTPETDILVESFDAALSGNKRAIDVVIVLHNQGDIAAINGTVDVFVEAEGANGLQDTQAFDSVIAGGLRTLNFSFDISNYVKGTKFKVYAEAHAADETVKSRTVNLEKP